MPKKRKSHKRKSHRKSARIRGSEQFSPSVVSGIRKRHKRKKSRKIGAIGNELMPIILGGLGGAVAGIIIDKYVPIENGKIKTGLGVAAGAAVIYLGAKKKNAGITSVGVGLLAIAGINAAKEFGLLSGMDEFMRGIGLAKEDSMLIEMSGTDVNSTKFISGKEEFAPSVVSGEQKIMGTANEMPSVVSGY